MHDRRIEPRRAIGEPHRLRLRRNRALEQALHLVDQGAAAGGGDAQRQRAGNIDAAGVHRRTGADRTGPGLAGHQALVDLGPAADQSAVGGNAFTGTDENPIARMQGRDRHLRKFAAWIEPVGEFRLEAREIAREHARLAPHRQVEVAAAQQEEQQHDRRIEIGVGSMRRGLEHRQAQR